MSVDSGLGLDRIPALADDAAWAGFAEPTSGIAFDAAWLALQCAFIAPGASGLLLRRGADGYHETAAHPGPAVADGLRAAATEAITLQRTLERRFRGKGGDRLQLALPIEAKNQVVGGVAIEVVRSATTDVQRIIRQLRWGAGWVVAVAEQRAGSALRDRSERLEFALSILSSGLEHSRFEASAFAAANALAVSLDATRVSIGLRRGDGRLRVVAMSHVATTGEKTRLRQLVTQAMEEALEQSATIALPAPAGGPLHIVVALRELTEAAKVRSAASLILSYGGRHIGAMTLERLERPFSPEELDRLDTAAFLLGPLLAIKDEGDAFIAGKLKSVVQVTLGRLIGRRHLALKFSVLAAVSLLAFSLVVEGEFRVSASAVLEGTTQRAATAPFDGFVATAFVRAGDIVAEGQQLASMDSSELGLDVLARQSERAQEALRYEDALGRGDPSAARISAAALARLDAELQRAEDRLARASIVAPFAGLVVSGDLSQKLGTPVGRGDTLFEIAPLDSYRVILDVDERDVGLIAPGDVGDLLLLGVSERSLPFRVTLVTPVATARAGHNVFRAEADLLGSSSGLRPGLEGVGKVGVDRRPLLAIWLRSLIEWARLTLWQWTP